MKQSAIIACAAASLFVLTLLATSWAGRMEMSDNQADSAKGAANEPQADPIRELEKATFGTGCFWCTEAVFGQLQGVESVVSGYSGGTLPDPSYEQICGGLTGHAEVVQITYDPSLVSYDELLEVFWQTHDPTTLDRQGNDVGTQYRSAIFYHSDEQRKLAEHYKQKLHEAGAFGGPIVTEVTPYTNFYPAEKYHQGYFALNPYQPYCAAVIRPKVEKFKKAFQDKLKDSAESSASSK